MCFLGLRLTSFETRVRALLTLPGMSQRIGHEEFPPTPSLFPTFGLIINNNDQPQAREKTLSLFLPSDLPAVLPTLPIYDLFRATLPLDLQECRPWNSLPRYAMVNRLHWLETPNPIKLLPGNPALEHVPCVSKPKPNACLTQNSRVFASGNISSNGKSNILTIVAEASQVSSAEKAMLLT